MTRTEQITITYTILIGNMRKERYWRSKSKRKMNLKGLKWKNELDLFESRYGLISGFCEHGNTPSCFIEYLEFHEKQNRDVLLEEDPHLFCQLDRALCYCVQTPYGELISRSTVKFEEQRTSTNDYCMWTVLPKQSTRCSRVRTRYSIEWNFV